MWPSAVLAQTSETKPHSPTGPDTLDSDTVDGFVVALGPLGAAARRRDEWDGAFGGELSLVRIRERSRLVAVGVAVGGARFAARDEGWLWVEGLAATNGPWRIPVGLSFGGSLTVDEDALARPGLQAGLWAFVGVVPYVRTGWVSDLGLVMDIGVKIALPTLQWN